MWRQRRDLRFSAQGYAKALQCGTAPESMRDALSACIGCGACDLVCPAHIDLTAMIQTSLHRADLPAPATPAPDHFATVIHSALRQRLLPDDLYIIDAAIFHAHYRERVDVYTALRHHSGCSMNLDLQRLAIATGIGSHAAEANTFDVVQQVTWLTQGRSFNRIVIENPNHKEQLAKITGKPVVHIRKLIDEKEV